MLLRWYSVYCELVLEEVQRQLKKMYSLRVLLDVEEEIERWSV